ncbi:hypothetical protein [Estrella lausannensis]|uniref:FlgN protein n=1 Tax=Estrella lausannensis TaxID=483423 RepID=A0A0H5DP69_9BACT|nr:hypothetical protein [Estrella lausannensis]CRX37718.1 hypothetical protein ELAC_0357 [Estrella lausannensis]
MDLTEKTVADLECALEKQIRSLRGLLSSLTEEEEGLRDGNEERVEEILERRLSLFELFEEAEEEARPLIEQYTIDLKIPNVQFQSIKLEELLYLKEALSYEDVRLMALVDQLITLVEKIHEKSHSLLVFDYCAFKKENYFLRQQQTQPKKPKTQVGLIESRRSYTD